MTSERPIARSVRVLAILTILATVVLLTLGALTTSFRAGMADPVWPTEPWYLAVNSEVWREAKPGFLLEHTHRAAGFTVGALASLLAIAAWVSGPNIRARLYGLLSVLALLAAYGGFHRQMHAASEARAARQIALLEGRTDIPAVEVFPVESGIATGVCAALVLIACGLHLTTHQPGKWVRALAGIVLVCVMIQGLLGGYRVYLDQLLGPELSQIHGTFAQVVFAAMCCIPILSAPARPDRELPLTERRRLAWLSLALPVAVFVQLIWGVVVRHTGSPVAQRLHILTAFVVIGIGVGLAARALAMPGARRVIAFDIRHMLFLFAVQVALGVEAYISKFAAMGAQWDIPPMARTITMEAAAIRTLHVLIGTAIFASSVVLALKVWRHVPRLAPIEPVPMVEPTHQYEPAAISLH